MYNMYKPDLRQPSHNICNSIWSEFVTKTISLKDSETGINTKFHNVRIVVFFEVTEDGRYLLFLSAEESGLCMHFVMT